MNTHSFSTRLLAMLLSLMMVLGMVPASVLAAEAETEPAEVPETVAEEIIEGAEVSEEETEAPVVETTEATVEEAPAEAAVEEVPVEAPVEEIVAEAPVEADDFFIDDFFIEEPPVAEAAAQTVLTEGRYTVPVVELKSGAPIPAIAAAFKTGFGSEIQVDVDAEGTMTATILPQHMTPVIGDITYHCNVLKIMANSVEATYPQMQTQLVTKQFGIADTQEINCPAKAVVVLPAFDEQKAGYPMQVTVDFMNGMYGDINADNWMDVVLKLDLANAKKENTASEADIKAAAAVDSKIDAIGSNITLGSDYAVTKAREAYEALTDTQKALVTKLDVLEAAEQAVLDIKTPVFTAPKNGVYDAAVTMLHEYKEQSSMCDPMFDAKAEIVVKDDMAAVTILVANPVPAFPDQGADGTVKNMFIDYGGQHYAFESQLGTGAMMTAKVRSPLFGFEEGSQYPAQVLTVTLPSQAIGVGSRLATNAYVNVVMNSDQIFRMNITSLEVNPDAAAAAAVDAKIEAIGEITSLVSAYKVSSAREAYEALTEAQKALVTKLDVLEAAEQAILDLKTPVFTAPTNGRYAATVTMLHEYKEQSSMCDPMFDAKAEIVVKDDTATVTILVANPVPAFPDQGADGTVKNMFIDYGGQHYDFESQLGTGAMMTAKVYSYLFGLEEGSQYPAQVLTVTLPAQAIGEGTKLVTNAYVNVVMNSDEIFRMNLTNLQVDPDTAAAAAVDAKIEAIGEITSLVSAYKVSSAREAYEALTDTQKALVTKLDVLEAAEQAILDLKTPVFTAPTNGRYAATVTMLHEYKEQPSMCNIMFDAKADIVVKDDTATVTILVANPVPGFPDQGADGTVQNVFIDYGGKQYAFESQLGTDAMMTARDFNTLFGFEEGSQYPAQVLTVTIPAQAIGEGTKLVTNAYVNVVMNSDEIFRMNLTDLTKLIPDNPFVDVSEKAYYYTPVLWAVENNITHGVTADHFEPDTECTRGQIVTFLWNAAGKPEPKSTENPFVDVNSGNYFYKAVLWAVESGITHGIDDTHFGPGMSCSRAQAVAFLWNAKGKPAPKTAENPFQDVSEKAYYYNAVLWAVENGITHGIDDTHFAPDTTCTRGQIVRFLWCDAGRPAI